MPFVVRVTEFGFRKRCGILLLCRSVGTPEDWSEILANWSNYPGIPHYLTETDQYKGYIIPNGSLIIPNIWYVFTIIVFCFVTCTPGQCSATQGFTWIRRTSTRTASWQLKTMSRRWTLAKLVYLGLGGGAYKQK